MQIYLINLTVLSTIAFGSSPQVQPCFHLSNPAVMVTVIRQRRSLRALTTFYTLLITLQLPLISFHSFNRQGPTMTEIFAPIIIFYSCVQDTHLLLFNLPLLYNLFLNALPVEIRMSTNRDKFKVKVRKYFKKHLTEISS